MLHVILIKILVDIGKHLYFLVSIILPTFFFMFSVNPTGEQSKLN